GITFICAGIGYQLARHSDERLWADQRVALRNAISDFRALFGHGREVDPRFVHMVEESVGLKALRFEAAPDPDRETQPVLNADGRIVGFFTWERSHPITQSVVRFLPLVFWTALVLAGFAGISLDQLRRARRELAASEEQATRAADLDKLTGLPNHAKTLTLLDLALAERPPEDVTTFALIEIDGMADVNANLGVLASDELFGAIVRRLTEALPANALCGRIGSNEFAVVITAASDFDVGTMLAN